MASYMVIYRSPFILRQIAEVNPHMVNLASTSQYKSANKRQASADYSNIRIHNVFVDGTSSLYSQVQAPNSPFFNAIKTLSSVLMVRPVQGNLVIPPMCNEYTYGNNEGKCREPLPSQSDFMCGEFGVIPPEYIGTREVCTSSYDTSDCIEQGLNGTGIPDADYLLFVSAVTTRELIE